MLIMELFCTLGGLTGLSVAFINITKIYKAIPKSLDNSFIFKD